ncbi:hypothetical protein SLEP1_g4157 [Rubroshorea leprosula]|uniref:Helicase C-terminal domain-containing protein n=1 Tax=Rubroshorea leprosula TaxID=152421 RepID=A0AAV5HU79_9ROSI|nr:hypothetical protein SLEP1_g4157 [Rubroshorea leprosula]
MQSNGWGVFLSILSTMREEVDELVKLSLNRPIRVSADPSAKRPSTLTEELVRVHGMREVNQEAVLLSLCSKTFTSKVIIFRGTKQTAHRLKILFKMSGLQAAELHGDRTQVHRLDDGISLVDLAYRRAKAKAVKKAVDAGKMVKKPRKKSKHPSQKTQSRTEEMRELFQDDMSEKKKKSTLIYFLFVSLI